MGQLGRACACVCTWAEGSKARVGSALLLGRASGPRRGVGLCTVVGSGWCARELGWCKASRPAGLLERGGKGQAGPGRGGSELAGLEVVAG